MVACYAPVEHAIFVTQFVTQASGTAELLSRLTPDGSSNDNCAGVLKSETPFTELVSRVHEMLSDWPDGMVSSGSKSSALRLVELSW